MKRLFTLFVPVLMLAGPAFAFGPPDGPHPSPEVRLEKALDAAEATPEQRGLIETLFEDTLPKLKSLHEEGRTLRESMRAAFLADTVDRNEVEQIRLDGLDLMDRMSETVLDAVVQGANVLSADQRVKVMELHDAHHERMRRFHQQRGE